MTDTQSPDTSSDSYVSAGTRGLGNWLDSRTGYRALVKSALTSESRVGLVGVTSGEVHLFSLS